MEGVVNIEQDIKPQTTHVKPMCARRFAKKASKQSWIFFGNKAIVGTKGATAYSFKEPTMPKKAWRLLSLDSFPSSTLLLSNASDTSCESAI
jgi:hypothetical protein